jgi:hypothetical protein
MLVAQWKVALNDGQSSPNFPLLLATTACCCMLLPIGLDHALKIYHTLVSY